jgi:serine/threonine protein phosphatase PrpC
MRLQIFYRTGRGRVRAHNEDSLAIDDDIPRLEMSASVQRVLDTDRPRVVLVADGMGGENSGEIASRLVGERLAMRLKEITLGQSSIVDMLRKTNRDVFDEMTVRPELGGMGSTVAGMVIANGDGWTFNVGDSRTYRLQDRYLEQLSHDDSADSVSYGHADNHAKTGRITQCLGGARQFIEIDPHVRRVRLATGSQFLLCSDGLSDVVSLDDMELACAEANGVQVVDALFEAAMTAGGPDNISIVLIRVEKKDGPTIPGTSA